MRLMLGPTAESRDPAHNASERSHVATEHVLAASDVIIAPRAIGTHSHAKNVGETFQLQPVAVDYRQSVPSYSSELLKIIGYVDFDEVLHCVLAIFVFSGPLGHRAATLRFQWWVVLPS